MTKEPIFSSDRWFEVFRYSASHGQLLIRGHKENRWKTRIELLFKDVRFLAVPTMCFLKGLTITELEGPKGLPAFLSDLPALRPWYRLEGEEFVGYVSAGAFYTSEDELEYNEPSALMRPPYV